MRRSGCFHNVLPFLLLSGLLYITTICESVGIKRRLHEAAAAGAGASSQSGPSEPSSSSNAPRHGVRHRLDAAPSSDSSVSKPKKPRLWESMRKSWAKGDITSKHVQQFAYDAYRDGIEGMEPMAAMGNFGNNPQNLFRAMQSVLGYPLGAPMMEWFDIPTKSSRHTSHPFLMPHAFFGKYFHERPNEFSTVMSGAAGACYEFLGLYQRYRIRQAASRFGRVNMAPSGAFRNAWRRWCFRCARLPLCTKLQFSNGQGHNGEEKVPLHSSAEVGNGGRHA